MLCINTCMHVVSTGVGVLILFSNLNIHNASMKTLVKIHHGYVSKSHTKCPYKDKYQTPMYLYALFYFETCDRSAKQT